MYQSHPPSSTDAAEPTSSVDSNTVGDAVTEPGGDVALNRQGPWIVDTISLAEYEAQLKAQAESNSDPVDDSMAKAVADAYFDRSSDEEIDAPIVLDNAAQLDAESSSTIQQTLNAEPDLRSPLVVDAMPHSQYQPQSIAQTESVADPVDDSMAVAQTDANSDTMTAEESGVKINVSVDVVDDRVSALGSTSTGDAVTNVVEASNPYQTSASNTDLSSPVLLTVGLGLALGLTLLVWNLGNLLSWYSRKRENQFLQSSQNAQKSFPLKTEDGVGVSLKKEVELPMQREALEQELKNNVSFKKVAYAKRKNEFTDGAAGSNSLLESELLNAQESLALVKANSQRRDAEFQAKLKRLKEQLHAQTTTIAGLESNLRISEEGRATTQSKDDKRKSARWGNVEQLEEELSSKTTAFSQLESDFLASKEALVAAQANAAERTKELLVDVELLGEELSAQTENATKLEAELARTKKSLHSHKDVEKELEAQQQLKEQAFEKQLATQTDALQKLESNLLKSEESLAAAEIRDESRANELQAKIKRLEEELSSKASASTRREADLRKAEQDLAQRAAVEQQRNAELQTKSNELEQKLRTQTADFAELNSKLLSATNALSAAQTKNSQHAHQSQTNLNRLEEELKTEKAVSRKLDAEVTEMREAFNDQQASLTQQSQRTTELQAELIHSEEEAQQLRLELSKEKATVAETAEELATSRSEVSRLRKERSNAAVNRSNYMKLAKKVVHYKKLYRANEQKIKDLAEQKIGMSNLASEYLEAADGMIEELSGQARLVAELKQRMLQTEASNTDFERNGLSEQRPHEDLLALAAEFEISSNNSTLMTSDVQSKSS